MPELPEVETVRRGLERTIVSKMIAAVDVRVKKLFADDSDLILKVVIGAKVIAVHRRAKVLLIDLSSGWTLAIHLKMTGQLIVEHNETLSKRSTSKGGPSASSGSIKVTEVTFIGGHPEKVYEQPLPHKHTHVIIDFTDGTQLYFNDLRKFGWMRLLRSNDGIMNHELGIREIPTVDKFIDSLRLGPEPLSADFTLEYFTNLLKKRAIPIKQLLLEQKGISGIGNIYADEALFRAGIHPSRKAIRLKRSEIKQLYQAVREVLKLGIKYGGTSKNTYRNVEGTKGEMQNHLMVYGRAGKPCKVCGTSIERIKIGQRSSHFCPKCQK